MRLPVVRNGLFYLSSASAARIVANSVSVIIVVIEWVDIIVVF